MLLVGGRWGVSSDPKAASSQLSIRGNCFIFINGKWRQHWNIWFKYAAVLKRSKVNKMNQQHASFNQREGTERDCWPSSTLTTWAHYFKDGIKLILDFLTETIWRTLAAASSTSCLIMANHKKVLLELMKNCFLLVRALQRCSQTVFTLTAEACLPQ